MEFYRIKTNFREIHVIFTGPQYLFFDTFHGLVAKADRQDGDVVEETTFNVEHTDVINMSVIKRVINKAENKYIRKTITYNETHVQDYDSLQYYVEVNTRRY